MILFGEVYFGTHRNTAFLSRVVGNELKPKFKRTRLRKAVLR